MCASIIRCAMETREAVQRLILVEPKRVYDLHESAINVVVPDRGRCGCGRAGGCGSRGPGGRCSACSRVAATRVRWASGCACAAYPRAGPGAFRCEVPRHVVKCRATVLRVSLTRVSSMCAADGPHGHGAAVAGRGPSWPRCPSASRSFSRGIWFWALNDVALPCAGSRYVTNTKLHGSFADRPRPISREFSFTHFVTDALPPASARNRKSLYPLRNDQRPRSAYRTKWCGVLAVS